MSKIRNYLVTACGFVVLVGAVVLSSPITANSQARPSNVIVVNPASNPVPTRAQGTTTIAGNVSVTNTPTVNLASGASVSVTNTPTVNLASGASIGINNTTANPVLVRNVDGKVTFQKQVFFDIPSGTNAASAASVVVPSGKRAVIEHVTGYAQSTTFVIYLVIPNTQENGGPVTTVPHFLVSAKQGDMTYIASQALRTYSGQGNPIYLSAQRDGPFDSPITVVMSISGYYEDLP